MELALDEPTQKMEYDEVLEEDGLTYIIDKRIFERVKPLRIEFIEDAGGARFEVTHYDPEFQPSTCCWSLIGYTNRWASNRGIKTDTDPTRKRVFRGGPQRLSEIREGKREELGLPRRFNMSQYEEDVSKNQKDMSKDSQVTEHDDEKGWVDGWVSPPPPVGRRMLKFPDDTQVGVIGLDDIMVELHAEGKKATDQTAEEIIKRLEARNNYIPSSERTRTEYAYVLLREYRTYVKERSGGGR